MKVLLSSALHRQLLSEAAMAHPHECCGLLFGTAGRVDTAQACTNVADDPARTFEIAPTDLIAAERAARGGGPTLIGYYHSHPNGRAEPSERDATDAARDGRLWLIIAGREITAWYANEAGAVHGAFDPLEIVLPDP